MGGVLTLSGMLWARYACLVPCRFRTRIPLYLCKFDGCTPPLTWCMPFGNPKAEGSGLLTGVATGVFSIVGGDCGTALLTPHDQNRFVSFYAIRFGFQASQNVHSPYFQLRAFGVQ